MLEVAKLVRSTAPWSPVGNDIHGTIYRLVPGAHGLLPDGQAQGPFLNQARDLSLDSLAADLLQLSVATGFAGFTFREIGALQYWRDDAWKLRTKDDAANGPWEHTGFYTVARVNRDGHIEGFYIIYGTQPEDTAHDNWGRLPGCRCRFSVAKIANDVADLRFSRTFQLTEVWRHPVELVRDVDSLGPIGRVTARK